jgi:hypothetical protein
MKKNSRSLNAKILTGVIITLALILLAGNSPNAVAQNTFPNPGNVGIGTTAPIGTLEVHSTSSLGIPVYTSTTDGFVITNANRIGGLRIGWDDVNTGFYQQAFRTNNSAVFSIFLNPLGGNVGIGTTSPGALFHIKGNPSTAALRIEVENDNPYQFQIQNRTLAADWSKAFSIDQSNTGVVYFYNNGAIPLSLNPNGDFDIRNRNLNVDSGVMVVSGTGNSSFIGNVGIGKTNPGQKLEVVGNINVTASGTEPGNITLSGTINAKYQDVAEWVPSSEQITIGTVVVLDSTKSNQVISSTQAYDTRVAGVVSERPGLALGESGSNKVLVATTGRVRVKVDATKSPIHIGDLLVTSDVPGVAMKSESLNLGGVQIHRPGTLIGKALEPLEKGSGKILVLLSLQ